jgi:hypothetical protein
MAEISASIGENNPNWVVFPGKIVWRSLKSPSSRSSSRRASKVAAAAAKNFFNFLLAIFWPTVHSRKKLQGVCQEKLARCP